MRDPECVFCKIVAGEIPSASVLDRDNVYAFLDLNPVRQGHALVIPKSHYPTLLDLDPGLAADLLRAQQDVARAVMLATGADGVNLGLNLGEAAGQVVFHAHYHIIPRFHEDGLRLWPQTPYPSQDEMNRLAGEIRARLG
ncbi:HIT family protein [Desulfohalovibrio reitneri]|uniref:HIT family protein n=1 Tax=Desulfohalovibrio reitneri TaxID=1307759 RepID=UPI0004A6AC57|nr:HIT family protein [Desulfohalovibrio reitneri]